MSGENPSSDGNEASVNSNEALMSKPKPESQVKVDETDNYRYVATISTTSVANAALPASSNHANGDVAAFTSTSETSTPPPSQIFKTDADDDTPKTFPQIVSF
jgi:hypothetical protein